MNSSGAFHQRIEGLLRKGMNSDAAFVPFSFMFYDRIDRGDDPSEFWIDRIRCLDVGVDRGGYGETLFRIYCEKALSTRAR